MNGDKENNLHMFTVVIIFGFADANRGLVVHNFIEYINSFTEISSSSSLSGVQTINDIPTPVLEIKSKELCAFI